MLLVVALLLSGAFPTFGPPRLNDGQVALTLAEGQAPGPAEPAGDDLGFDGPEARTGEGSSDLSDVPRTGLRLATGDEGRRLPGHSPLMFKPPRPAV